MKKDMQLRYGFFSCDFLFVDRPFFHVKKAIFIQARIIPARETFAMVLRKLGTAFSR